MICPAQSARRGFISLLTVLAVTAGLLAIEIPGAEAHGTADQEQTAATDSLDLCGYFGQTFTPTGDTLTGFDLQFFGAGIASLQVKRFGGAVLTAVGPLSIGGGEQHFDLPSPVFVTPGLKYSIEVVGLSGCPSAGYSDANPYPGGATLANGWGENPWGYDWFFRTYSVADADADGVPDASDSCSATAPGAAVDGNGCSSTQGGSPGTSPCGTSGVFSSPTTCTYPATDEEDTFNVPAGVTSIHVVAVGGSGGGAGRPSSGIAGAAGGLGARIEADVTVSTSPLFVAVGGNGGHVGGAGGFNGGASGGGTSPKPKAAPGPAPPAALGAPGTTVPAAEAGAATSVVGVAVAALATEAAAPAAEAGPASPRRRPVASLSAPTRPPHRR